MPAVSLNNPIANVPIRVSPFFGLTVRFDRLLSYVGLRLPVRVVAWVIGRSIFAFVDGKWRRVPISAREVINDACR